MSSLYPSAGVPLSLKHPEVKKIGFLTLLFAVTLSISFKYSIFKEKVKKLKQLDLSAGNNYIKDLFSLFKFETSETLCNETVKFIENIKSIPVHIPKHFKPISDNDFGHYLAGLIEGDGHFSNQQQLIIAFHSLDVSLAYYIKERLGYGSVKKIKNKNAYIFIISSKEGLKKVINLIN